MTNKWLHQHGFNYKKTNGVPPKFDIEKQTDFIKYYELLKSQVIEEQILFNDALHSTQSTKVSCGWIKTGYDKSIKMTGRRTRLSIVVAVELNDISSTSVNRYDQVNSLTIQYFF